MNKQDIRRIAIDAVVLVVAIGIGIVLKNRVAQQPVDNTQLHSTNWFIAIPLFLLSASLVVMGYLIDRRVAK